MIGSPRDLALAAAFIGDAQTLESLLDQGMSPDAADEDGDTLLETAISKRRMNCVDLLLSRGANPNGPNRDGSPISLSAYSQERFDFFKRLLEAGADPNLHAPECHPVIIHVASDQDWLPFLIELLKYKPGLDVRNEADESPLTYAIAYENLEGARLLLDAGMDVNARVCKGETPLLVATGICSERGLKNTIIDLLLDRGADPNLIALPENFLAGHKNALMMYIRCNPPTDQNLSTARRIAMLTRELNEKTPEGQTALMMAREVGHSAYVNMLRELGARDD